MEAECVLRAYARHAAAAPDELSTQAMLMSAPPAPFIPPAKHGTPVVAILMCYTGDLAEGERVVAPLRKLGTPIADVIAPMPYPVMFSMTEEGTIRGLQQHVRSLFLQKLNDDVLHTLVEVSAPIMSPEMMVQLRVLGGAMGRVPADTVTSRRWSWSPILVRDRSTTSAAMPERSESGRPYGPTPMVRTSTSWQTRGSSGSMRPTLLRRMRG